MPPDAAEGAERPAISHWAKLYGLADEDALALAAAILAGLANGLPRLNLSGVPVAVEPLALVTSADSRVMAPLARIAAPALRIQKLLVQRSRSLSQDKLREAYLDRMRWAADSSLDAIASEHARGCLGDDPDSILASAITTGNRDRAFEKFARPSIIFGGTLPEDLAGRLSHYHLGSMLAAPGVVRLPADKRKRAARVDELMRCAQGLEADSIPLHRDPPGDRGVSETRRNRNRIRGSVPSKAASEN